MGGGAHLRMDLPQPEDGQRLREAVRHRRGLHLRGYDADHGEAVSQCLGLSRQSLERLSGNSARASLRGPTRLPNGANEHLFRRLASPKEARSDPHSDFPDGLWKGYSPKFALMAF